MNQGNMRIHGGILFAAILAAALVGLGSAHAETTDLKPVLETIRTRTGMPGLAAAVVRNGEIVAIGVDGVRAKGAETPVSIDDPFLIGSCAKAMLRTLVARLVDAGTLGFDTTLGEALKDVAMRDEYRNVTLRQVLSHRGGIQPYTEIGPKLTPWLFELKGTAVEQREAFTLHVLNEPPAAPPGTQEVYSNAGYGIIAHITERLTGKPWEDLVQEQVFAPLAMTTARIGLPTSAEHPEGVRGHFRGPKEYELTEGWRKPLAPIAPAGIVSCSIADFARFAGKLALIEAGRPGDFLTAKAAEALRNARPVTGSIEGVPFFGGEGTFTAAFAVWPSLALAIVVETNGGESDNVCQDVIEAVRAATAHDASAPPPLEDEAGPPHPGNRGSYGFMIRAIDDNLEIDSVVPDSPADRGGLRKGDVVVKINGKPVAGMSPDERMAALRDARVTLTVRRDGAETDISLVK